MMGVSQQKVKVLHFAAGLCKGYCSKRENVCAFNKQAGMFYTTFGS